MGAESFCYYRQTDCSCYRHARYAKGDAAVVVALTSYVSAEWGRIYPHTRLLIFFERFNRFSCGSSVWHIGGHPRLNAFQPMPENRKCCVFHVHPPSCNACVRAAPCCMRHNFRRSLKQSRQQIKTESWMCNKRNSRTFERRKRYSNAIPMATPHPPHSTTPT